MRILAACAVLTSFAAIIEALRTDALLVCAGAIVIHLGSLAALALGDAATRVPWPLFIAFSYCAAFALVHAYNDGSRASFLMFFAGWLYVASHVGAKNPHDR